MQTYLQCNCDLGLHLEDPKVENNTWRRGRYEFYFRVVKTIVYEILFLPPENKIHAFKPPYNFLFYYVEKSVVHHFSPTVRTNNREKAGNDAINILISEDMENTSLRSRM